MRRILLVLSVAALMAAMLVASAMPAFADKGGNCPNAHANEHAFANAVEKRGLNCEVPEPPK